MAYIVVSTKYLTKWMEAKAVKTITATNAATVMYDNISRFGCPKILVSDREIHDFVNSLIQKMTYRFQINHRKTNSCHLQTKRNVLTGHW